MLTASLLEQALGLQILELGQALQGHLRVLERLVVWVLWKLQEPPPVQLAPVLRPVQRPVQLTQQHLGAHARLVEVLEMVLQVLLQLVALTERSGLETVPCWVAEHSQASGLVLGQQSCLAGLEEEVVVALDFEPCPGRDWVVWILASLLCSGSGWRLSMLGAQGVEA